MQKITSRVLKTETICWKDLEFIQDDNFKEWIAQGDRKLLESLVKYQFIDPFKVWENDGKIYCLDGKHRWTDLKRAQESGIDVPDILPATFIACTDIKEAAELVLVYSSFYAKITSGGLQTFIEKFNLDFPDLSNILSLPEIDLLSFGKSFNEQESQANIVKSLQERFVIPPFSIFDTRQGYWQERKKQWHQLGFNSQESREDVELIAKSGQAPNVYKLRNEMREKLGRDPDWDEIIAEAKRLGMHIYEGASIFDPVLAEICYKWFCPEGGSILDPFAGGSVRGIVAGVLGFPYFGIDLRHEQVRANDEQAEAIFKDGCRAYPVWATGDSAMYLDNVSKPVDFIFSCPPYHDLEKYSDDPADLSNMTYEQFANIYRSIITKSMAKLKQDRFACFVIADIRDEKGFYRNFISETIDCFTKCIDENGDTVKLYNEIILINVAGSVPIRVGRQFEAGRKVGKVHQNVLVFYKGDPKKIRENFPEIKIDKLEETGFNPPDGVEQL